jgi:hypothetical protein
MPPTPVPAARRVRPCPNLLCSAAPSPLPCPAAPPGLRAAATVPCRRAPSAPTSPCRGLIFPGRLPPASPSPSPSAGAARPTRGGAHRGRGPGGALGRWGAAMTAPLARRGRARAQRTRHAALASVAPARPAASAPRRARPPAPAPVAPVPARDGSGAGSAIRPRHGSPWPQQREAWPWRFGCAALWAGLPRCT